MFLIIRFVALNQNAALQITGWCVLSTTWLVCNWCWADCSIKWSVEWAWMKCLVIWLSWRNRPPAFGDMNSPIIQCGGFEFKSCASCHRLLVGHMSNALYRSCQCRGPCHCHRLCYSAMFSSFSFSLFVCRRQLCVLLRVNRIQHPPTHTPFFLV